ncbi:MAG TPA: hypothetical protein VHV78_15015 [Gemmatimonadaceae bacterium]|jgi:hypothetical protein|nr:hypothetical protein [Gemmatimonadaceae bacterium]
MTNPDDRWRHQSSAAPHAPSHDPLTPGLPLQSSQPGMQLGDGGGAEAYPVYNGEGNPVLRNLGLALVAACIVLIFSPVIFGTLYPLSTGIAFVSAFIIDFVLRGLAPAMSPEGRLPIDMLAGVIAFWPLCRLDHFFAASHAAYRRGRHVFRIAAFALYTTITTFHESGTSWGPRSIGEGLRSFVSISHLIVFGLTALFAQWLLRRARRPREWWEGALELVRLRPKGLPASDR